MLTNIVVVVILIIVIGLAIRSSLKHFKGQGSCCGGGDKTIVEKKVLDAPKLGEKEILIEGMHCENCKSSVERAVNSIDGAVCKVNLKKKTAWVEYCREISEDELKAAIEKRGYEVKEIKNGQPH